MQKETPITGCFVGIARTLQAYTQDVSERFILEFEVQRVAHVYRVNPAQEQRERGTYLPTIKNRTLHENRVENSDKVQCTRTALWRGK